jgi:hypothetical protein
MKNKFNVRVIDPLSDTIWDDFVNQHPLGWVCHLSSWKRVLESSFKHMLGYYFAILDDSNRKILAGLPVFHVKSWLFGDKLVSVPFATLCDPLVSTRQQFDVLFEAVRKLGNNLGVKHIEMRSFAAEPFLEHDQLGKNNIFKLHYLELNEEPSALLKNFHKSCVANQIKKASRSNLKLSEAENQTDLDDFYTLHKLTRKRLGLPVQPYRFFYNLWNVLGPLNNIKILIARHDKVVIGAMLHLIDRNRISNDYASSDFKSKNLRPTHFLYWESIKLAHSLGLKIFDFGRTPVSAESLASFKERWGTKTHYLSHYHYPKTDEKFFSSTENSLKYRLMQNLCKFSPDFAYRLISKFAYSHMG